MSSPASPTDQCPLGFTDEQVAALIDDPADSEMRRHTLVCRVCAERYFDHVVAASAVRRIVTAARTTDTSAPGRPTRILRFPRIPVAAAALLGAVGLAVAGAALLLGPFVFAPGGQGVGRMSEMELRTRLDLRGAGLSETSTIDGWTTALFGPERVGTVVAATLDASRHVEVAAFDADGSVRWTATGRGWRTVVGLDLVFVHGIGTIVTREDATAPEERLWTVVSRWNTGAVLLADAASGDLAGAYVHPGPLARSMRGGARVVTLPAAPGQRRHVLVTGHHMEESDPVLCLSVVDVDGTLLQHVRIPNFVATRIGPEDVLPVVDWRAGHRELTLYTSQAVAFRIPVVEGRLDSTAARATFADPARAVFDKANRESGLDFDTWLAGRDPLGGNDRDRGRQAAESELARGVRETPIDLPPTLGDR